MATDLPASFADQYMHINAKLKKRFLRKPNITEVTNELNALAIQCEHSEQPAFAAHTYVAAAKCENSVGNFLGEGEYYLAAARQFMKAEMKLAALMCYSPARENLEAAIGCYIQTSNKYPEMSPLRTAILMELANSLVCLGHNSEAMWYYEQALDTISDDDALRVKCLCKLMELRIQHEQYESALEVSNKLCEMDRKWLRENVLMDVQINRILLVLIVEPAEQSIPPSLKKLFCELGNEDDDFQSDTFHPDLAIKLQSIIISCNEHDMESLVAISADTKKLFTIQQQDLFIHLIRAQENKL